MLNKVRINYFEIGNWFIAYYVSQYLISPLIYFFIQKKTFLKLDESSFANSSYSFFLILIGFLSFVAGNKLNINFAPLKSKFEPNFIRLKIGSYLFLIMSLFFFLVLIKSEGGISAYLSNLNFFRVYGIIGKGVFYYPAIGIIPILIIWLIYQSKTENRPFPNILISLLLCTFLICAFLLSFRGPIISLGVSLVVLSHNIFHKLRLKQFLLIVLIFYAMFFVGNVIQKQSTTIEYSAKNYPWFNFFQRSNGLLVLNQTLEVSKHKTKTTTPLDAVIETVTILIPRAVWDEKPQPLNLRYTTEVFKMRNTSISPTILGYITWLSHPLCIVPVLFILGIFYRQLSNYFENEKYMNFSFLKLWYFSNFPAFVVLVEAPQLALNSIVLNSGIIFLFFILCRVSLKNFRF